VGSDRLSTAYYPDKFLKVLLRGTFKNLSGFYDSEKRCNRYANIHSKGLKRD
jgi:hypothetical protein